MFNARASVEFQESPTVLARASLIKKINSIPAVTTMLITTADRDDPMRLRSNVKAVDPVEATPAMALLRDGSAVARMENINAMSADSEMLTETMLPDSAFPIVPVAIANATIKLRVVGNAKLSVDRMGNVDVGMDALTDAILENSWLPPVPIATAKAAIRLSVVGKARLSVESIGSVETGIEVVAEMMLLSSAFPPVPITTAKAAIRLSVVGKAKLSVEVIGNVEVGRAKATIRMLKNKALPPVPIDIASATIATIRIVATPIPIPATNNRARASATMLLSSAFPPAPVARAKTMIAAMITVAAPVPRKANVGTGSAKLDRVGMAEVKVEIIGSMVVGNVVPRGSMVLSVVGNAMPNMDRTGSSVDGIATAKDNKLLVSPPSPPPRITARSMTRPSTATIAKLRVENIGSIEAGSVVLRDAMLLNNAFPPTPIPTAKAMIMLNKVGKTRLSMENIGREEAWNEVRRGIMVLSMAGKMVITGTIRLSIVGKTKLIVAKTGDMDTGTAVLKARMLLSSAFPPVPPARARDTIATTKVDKTDIAEVKEGPVRVTTTATAAKIGNAILNTEVIDATLADREAVVTDTAALLPKRAAVEVVSPPTEPIRLVSTDVIGTKLEVRDRRLLRVGVLLR